MIKVSIVITCYNLGDYLLEALDSLGEHREHFEVILVDDGSTEERTKQAIAELKDRIDLVINQENAGLGNARNTGIHAAKGQYIIPLDADNKLDTKFIGKAIALLENDCKIAAVYGNRMLFEGESGLFRPGLPELNRLLRFNYVDACAVIRKSALLNVGGYDEKMPIMGLEDWDIWLRLLAKGWNLHYIDDLAFYYRVRKNSMIKNTKKYKYELRDYIFNKSELHDFSVLRNGLLAEKRLTQIEKLPLLGINRVIQKLMIKLGLK